MNNNSSGIIPFIAGTATTTITAAFLYHYWNKQNKSNLEKLQELRAAERKGRIRAEIKLRELSKQVEANGFQNEDSSSLNMKCIGTISSSFTKRMGTPRQGALAPSARGYVQLIGKNCHPESIDGMEAYSHCWILFSFHANTNISQKKTKVRPPRGNGVKVGQLATRSPHRPNNIGLSLVQVDYVDKKNQRLYIKALDLVNGTPVYGKITLVY